MKHIQFATAASQSFTLVTQPLIGAWPRWLLMWLLAAAIYFGFKLLTWHAASRENVSVWRQWAYLFAWPGMNAARFFDSNNRDVNRPAAREWLAATFNLVLGGLIFWNAKLFISNSMPVLLGWAGMVGTILMLHFGSFHLLSCYWRSVGIDAPPLMNKPTHSTSLAEFWGRRWNVAFRDLTYQFLFRPLRFRLGPVAALALGFAVSGIVHDLVISVPSGGGYGGPTCFFLIQVAALLFERTPTARMIGFGSGWRGWLFTALVLIAPVRLLFHDAFVTRVVVPFMAAFGAA
jgi:hypothetical protein